MGLENKEPSYAKKDANYDEDDDEDKLNNVDEDDDFERDDDDSEVNNADSDTNKANDAIIAKKGHSVAVKVNINVKPINAKKSMADVNAEAEKAKPDFQTSLLDSLFSFIGT